MPRPSSPDQLIDGTAALRNYERSLTGDPPFNFHTDAKTKSGRKKRRRIARQRGQPAVLGSVVGEIP
jgi:hypothetical protein